MLEIATLEKFVEKNDTKKILKNLESVEEISKMSKISKVWSPKLRKCLKSPKCLRNIENI